MTPLLAIPGLLIVGMSPALAWGCIDNCRKLPRLVRLSGAGVAAVASTAFTLHLARAVELFA